MSGEPLSAGAAIIRQVTANVPRACRGTASGSCGEGAAEPLFPVTGGPGLRDGGSVAIACLRKQ